RDRDPGAAPRRARDVRPGAGGDLPEASQARHRLRHAPADGGEGIRPVPDGGGQRRAGASPPPLQGHGRGTPAVRPLDDGSHQAPVGARMMPRPDSVRHLPGGRLRRLAQRLCSPETLEHVVDPTLADLQHEWNEADGRSGLARGCVCLAGYAAFVKALTLHMLMTACRHLAGNAFGATPEERAFYGRAGSATAAAVLVQTAIMMVTSTGMGVRPLVYALTHQRWPGGPSEAESLPRALAIAFRPDYREIVVAELYRTDRKANVPAKGLRELTLGELGDAIRTEQGSSGRYLAPYRRT